MKKCPAIGFKTRPLGKDDRDWVAALIKKEWASTKIVSSGRIHHARLAISSRFGARFCKDSIRKTKEDHNAPDK